MFPDDPNPNNSGNDVSEIQVISRYVSLLWRWTWLIILSGCVAAGIAYFVCKLVTPVYQTSTSLLVLNAPYNSDQYYSSVLASQSLATTYANILTQNAILSEVISRLSLQTTPDLLSKSIKITPSPSTQMINISVEGSDRASITNIANTLATVFIDMMISTQADRFSSSKDSLQNELASIDTLIQSTIVEKDSTQDPVEKDKLETRLVQYRDMYATILASFEQTRLAEIQSTSNIVQVSPAGLTYTLSSPKILIITMLAGVMAMTLTAGFVIIRDALDNTLKTPEEIIQQLKLPVLGIIFTHTAKDSPITQVKPSSSSAESFRLLSNKIRYADTDHPLHSIMVTSPTKAEGKSTVSVNLAIVLAQAGNSVILIDANFSHPVIHNQLYLSNNVGLSELLVWGQAGLTKEGVIQKFPTESLYVISSGADPYEKRNLLISKNFGGVLSNLSNMNKFVVIDTAPVMSMADTLTLSTMVDGLLLVIQAGQTTLAEAKQAVESLRSVNAKIIGVVLNDVNGKASRYKPYFHDNER